MVLSLARLTEARCLISLVLELFSIGQWVFGFGKKNYTHFSLPPALAFSATMQILQSVDWPPLLKITLCLAHNQTFIGGSFFFFWWGKGVLLFKLHILLSRVQTLDTTVSLISLLLPLYVNSCTETGRWEKNRQVDLKTHIRSKDVSIFRWGRSMWNNLPGMCNHLSLSSALHVTVAF